MADINKTLIPNVDMVTSMKHFRPIGLCNVSYKTITKILSYRLKESINFLVGPAQCAFIPKRQGHDNIIVAQEIFHSMIYKKGAKGWIAIKIDLEKAYDRLQWDFFIDTLKVIGFPKKLINLIWHCISSPKMRLLWKEKPLRNLLHPEELDKETLYPLIFLCFALKDFST